MERPEKLETVIEKQFQTFLIDSRFSYLDQISKLLENKSIFFCYVFFWLCFFFQLFIC